MLQPLIGICQLLLFSEPHNRDAIVTLEDTRPQQAENVPAPPGVWRSLLALLLRSLILGVTTQLGEYGAGQVDRLLA